MPCVRPLAAVFAVTAALSSCSAPASPEPPRVASIEVRPRQMRLALLPAGGGRASGQLAAVLRDARGRVVERPVSWSIESGAVRVDAAGKVTLAALGGPGRVWASSDGVRAAAAVCPVIFQNDFEGNAPGPLTRAALDAEWNSPGGVTGVERVSVVTGGEAMGGGKSLKVEYPRGAVGPYQGGAMWVVPLGGSYPELHASYDVRFGPGFDFALGGKLPGLAGGTQNTGGVRPTGADGWSARTMWLAGGRMIQYVYHPDQPGTYGAELEWVRGGGEVRAVPGPWYHVEQRVVMNTPGRHDGIVQVWLDGGLVMDRRDLRFRDVSSFAIEAFHFTTFFGGSEPRFAARNDEAVYFDNVVISTFRIGPRGAAAPGCEVDAA